MKLSTIYQPKQPTAAISCDMFAVRGEWNGNGSSGG
jgi:hypothetical protein